MSDFKTVLIVGATGSIGSIILKALLAEPSLTITALQRAASKSKLPEGVRVITIDNAYPADALTAAFRGQDVVLNTMATAGVAEQYKFVDAAVAAGVKRYIPSEFGLNNMSPASQALTTVFATKGAVQAHLRAAAAEGKIEWTSFSPGLWLRWSMERGYIGMKVAEGKFTLWDDGSAFFSVTTEENTALAVVRALTTHASLTRNRNVFLQDFKTSQKEVCETIEKALGRKLEKEVVDGKARVAELQALVAGGDAVASYRLIEDGFAMGIGSWFEAEEVEILNERLGLPKTNVEEVVKEALKTLKLV